MKSENNKQNISISEIRKDIEYIQKDIQYIKNKMEKQDKNMTAIISSFNGYKNSLKTYMDDKYVEKKTFEPIRELYSKASMLGLGILIVIGGAGLFLITIVKVKLGL